MSNQWFRLWHDFPTDPKFRVVAKLSSQSISLVISTFIYLLTEASKNEQRGVAQCDAESISVMLDVEIDQVEKIFSAMQGRLLDGENIKNWDKRQPNREDKSAYRTMAYREKRKSVTQCDASVTQCDADVTQCDASVTQCDAVKSNVTLDKIRLDEIRLDQEGEEKEDKKKKINKKKETKKENPVSSNRFDEFWKLYPRRVGETRCREKFKQLCKKGTSPDLIISGLKKYLPIFESREMKFIPEPINFLNRERWNDEIKNDYKKKSEDDLRRERTFENLMSINLFEGDK